MGFGLGVNLTCLAAQRVGDSNRPNPDRVAGSPAAPVLLPFYLSCWDAELAFEKL
jgi:hypothetical protein